MTQIYNNIVELVNQIAKSLHAEFVIQKTNTEAWEIARDKSFILSILSMMQKGIKPDYIKFSSNTMMFDPSKMQYEQLPIITQKQFVKQAQIVTDVVLLNQRLTLNEIGEIIREKTIKEFPDQFTKPCYKLPFEQMSKTEKDKFIKPYQIGLHLKNLYFDKDKNL